MSFNRFSQSFSFISFIECDEEKEVCLTKRNHQHFHNTFVHQYIKQLVPVVQRVDNTIH